MPIYVNSQFTRLREAVVHRPGREVVRMTPSTRDYFLFDDLLYDEHAQQEHDWFTAVLRDHLGIKLRFFDTMLTEALQNAAGVERDVLINQVCALEADMPPVEQRVGQLEVLVRWYQGHGWPQYTHDPEGDPNAAAPGTLPGTLTSLLSAARDTGAPNAADLRPADYLRERLSGRCNSADFHTLAMELIEGIESDVVSASPSLTPGPPNGGGGDGVGDGSSRFDTDAEVLRRYIEGQLFYLTPVPNLMFTNDVGIAVGDRLLLSRMAAPGRVREPLLLDFVQRNHPDFAGTRRWTWADARISDPLWPVASSPALHLEGGNVLQLREDVLVVGVNQRTSIESVQRIADAWRAFAVSSGVRLILYVLRLPVGFNHLDSVLGIINHDECLVYPPVFEPYGPASVDVVRAELGDMPVRPTRSADFFESLRADGLPFTCIPCGGSDPVDQQREQWFSGVNVLAVAPGKVVIYRSCERTVDALTRHGYRVVDINEVEDGRVKLDLDNPDKWVLKIKGSELSRGHGGPHSLAMPLLRD